MVYMCSKQRFYIRRCDAQPALSSLCFQPHNLLTAGLNFDSGSTQAVAVLSLHRHKPQLHAATCRAGLEHFVSAGLDRTTVEQAGDRTHGA